MWQTIKLYWSYCRNVLGTLILLLPFFIAAWVFHLAMGLGNGPMDIWMGIMGAGAVLLLFRKQWRLWVILFPGLWRAGKPVFASLLHMLRNKLRSGVLRVQTDWNDLRRAMK